MQPVRARPQLLSSPPARRTDLWKPPKISEYIIVGHLQIETLRKQCLCNNQNKKKKKKKKKKSRRLWRSLKRRSRSVPVFEANFPGALSFQECQSTETVTLSQSLAIWEDSSRIVKVVWKLLLQRVLDISHLGIGDGDDKQTVAAITPISMTSAPEAYCTRSRNRSYNRDRNRMAIGHEKSSSFCRNHCD